MLKSLMRWIDSWSTPTAPETLTAENSKIQWLRIYPLFCCIWPVSPCSGWECRGLQLGFMLLFYLIRMFSITAFFSSLFVT